MQQKTIRTLGVVMAAAGLLAACGSGEKPGAPPAPAVSGVQTEVVQALDVPQFYPAAGTVRAANTAILAAQVAGAVREVRVNAGDRVRRGALLAVIDDRSAQAQVQGAQAGVSEAAQGEAEVDQARKAATADRQFAEATFNRYKELLAKNSLSRQEFDGAQARYQAALANEQAMEAKKQQLLARQQQARSQQASAQTYLSFTRVVAPFDGVVTAKSVDAGTVVMPGTPLITVEDTGRYRLEATLPEEYLASAQAGAAVSVSTEHGQCQGRVAEVVPAADPMTHTFLVKIDLPQDCNCRSGEYGQASFPVAATRSITVPTSALVDHGELEGVFVVTATGAVELRLVKTGGAVSNRVEILAGLSAGEKVVIAGADRLRDGARVEGL